MREDCVLNFNEFKWQWWQSHSERGSHFFLAATTLATGLASTFLGASVLVATLVGAALTGATSTGAAPWVCALLSLMYLDRTLSYLALSSLDLLNLLIFSLLRSYFLLILFSVMSLWIFGDLKKVLSPFFTSLLTTYFLTSSFFLRANTFLI